MNCVRCQLKPAKKARGLCRYCYNLPGRELFPILGAHKTTKERNTHHNNIIRRPLPRPTNAIPGTEEKLKVLESRVTHGEELWHPLDARLDIT